MFDNLRNAFSSAAKSFSEKELKDKDIDEILFQLEISLLESDVATEVIDSIKSDLKEKLIGTKVNRKEIESFIQQSLIQSISNLFDSVGKIDVLKNISEKKDSPNPYIILFVGINGTGKTTTLAKFAYLLQKSKISVVVAAADTYRAGAIEQLNEHTNRLNLKLVAQNYGSDPAAVAKDAVLYAISHKVDCVLIDTAGRMQTSKNLMDQITKITKVVNPDFKIFVGDSLAGNDTVSQAREFHNHVTFDGAILTKSDADARGGAALSIVKVTSTPVLYVGVGQEYPDLKPFDKESFIEAIFGKTEEIKVTSSDNSLDYEAAKKLEKIKPEPKIKTETLLEPQTEPTETKTELVKEENISTNDPFEGIKTDDINLFSDLFDEPPPENDKQAKVLSEKISKWISEGRPEPNKGKKETTEVDSKKESDKSKKKHSLFGRFDK